RGRTQEIAMYARGEGPRPEPGTLNQIFFDSIRRYDKADAMLVRVDGRWRPISHSTIKERVRRVALGLRRLGVNPGDRVAILSENRPEWALADWACLTSGVTDVPIYPSLPAEQIPYLLVDSGAVVAFVSTAAQAEKLASIRGRAPALRTVVAFDEAAAPYADLTVARLEQQGTALDTAAAAAEYEQTARAVTPDALATIIYTSGTTGAPKGVMLSHDNIHSNVAATRALIPIANDVALSFLPLCHIFERMGDYLYFSCGATIAYVDNFDLVPIAMQEVRPTIAMSVPRLYEKMYARVLENALAGGPLRKRIFFWARAVADRWATETLAGRKPPGALALQYALAQRLVFSKLKARTGGRLRYFISGGAPLAPEINKFFYAAGLTILEGYGLTETSPVIGVNTPEHFRIGTIGKPIAGVEVKIAPDGEILTRGPHVMQGYYNQPDATREAIDDEGWFRTGDIGLLEDGYLRITDRKKDIIVTAGGKNIAPQPIENLVKTSKYVSQAVMIGDRRKYPVLLVVPNFEQLEKWAKLKNLIWTDRSQLLAMPTVHAKVEQEIRAKLTGLASFETPKKIALLREDFTVETGELTPTLKVKRRVIEKNHRALIDSLYDAMEPAAVAGRVGT
ncbi:MAG TPA: long-chain fatty acid--CoA ligase, partial [Gemmatimonadaceae bacterium]|nr:long-chain fatty acid--CoA ligase [Gemmatimonadaceae bacterium]